MVDLFGLEKIKKTGALPYSEDNRVQYTTDRCGPGKNSVQTLQYSIVPYGYDRA